MYTFVIWCQYYDWRTMFPEIQLGANNQQAGGKLQDKITKGLANKARFRYYGLWTKLIRIDCVDVTHVNKSICSD